MKCEICGRDGLTAKELDIHTKYFHKLKQTSQKVTSGVCPECGSTLWFEEGCANCHTCGFSKCG